MFKFEMYMYIYIVFDSDNLKHNTMHVEYLTSMDGWSNKNRFLQNDIEISSSVFI